MSYRFADSWEQDQDGTNSIQILLLMMDRGTVRNM